MRKLPEIEGFIVQRVEAWWVTCRACEECELIYGVDRSGAARAWASDHARECAVLAAQQEHEASRQAWVAAVQDSWAAMRESRVKP